MPNFNLIVNVWNAGSNPAVDPPRLVVNGNLQFGRKIRGGELGTTEFVISYLLIPAHTDVRSPLNAAFGDLLEIPAGSHRYYFILGIEDVSKGFSSEYRCAVIQQKQVGGPWPTPIP